MEELWREYPDTPQPFLFFCTLSIPFTRKDEENTGKQGREITNGNETGNTGANDGKKALPILTLYPTNPLADEAGFALANVVNVGEDFETAVQLCQLNQAR